MGLGLCANDSWNSSEVPRDLIVKARELSLAFLCLVTIGMNADGNSAAEIAFLKAFLFIP